MANPTKLTTLDAQLGASYRKDENYRYTFDKFSSRPVFHDQDGDGSPTGSTGDENMMVTEEAHYEYHVLGTQTILFPSWGSNGLDFNSQDQVENDGVEFTQGITANSKAAFVIGTDEFFFKMTFDIADVSGTDDCAMGFRIAAAYQANIDDYTDVACLNVISGNINIETALNNDSMVTTDTTDNWLDTAEHTLEVRVDKGGNAFYILDGAEVSTTAAFTFDDADTVIPFFYVLNDANLAGAINGVLWECGLWSSRGLHSALDVTN